MKYQIVYEKRVIKSLYKIDKGQQVMILAWIEKNLVNTDEPRKHGKVLKSNLKEYWRYRVGDYRIITDINDDQIQIIFFNIGHRKEI